jgi:hypothetical protein
MRSFGVIISLHIAKPAVVSGGAVTSSWNIG